MEEAAESGTQSRALLDALVRGTRLEQLNDHGGAVKRVSDERAVYQRHGGAHPTVDLGEEQRRRRDAR
jgi:hypothetical protein